MSEVNALSTLPDSFRSFEQERQKEVKRTTSLGQADFLKLMTAQLKNQDPLKPMENGEFLGQMAQFSTVSGITEMNTSMQSLVNSLGGQQLMQASSMINKLALVKGNYAKLSEELPIRGALDLDSATSNAQVVIKNMSGEVVHVVEMGRRYEGVHEFSWDGSFEDGSKAPPGTYFIEASVLRDGTAIEPLTLVYGNVNSIQSEPDGAGLTVDIEGFGNVGLASVRRISH